jgi:hypothetical protein
MGHGDTHPIREETEREAHLPPGLLPSHNGEITRRTRMCGSETTQKVTYRYMEFHWLWWSLLPREGGKGSEQVQCDSANTIWIHEQIRCDHLNGSIRVELAYLREGWWWCSSRLICHRFTLSFFLLVSCSIFPFRSKKREN